MLHQRPSLMALWEIDIALFEYGFFALGKAYGKRGISFVSKHGGFCGIFISFFLCVAIVFLSIINGPINIYRGNYGNSMCLYYLEGMLGIVIVMIASSFIHLHRWGIIKSLIKWCGRHTMPVLLTHQTIILIINKYLDGVIGCLIQIVVIVLVWYVYVRIQETIFENSQKRC